MPGKLRALANMDSTACGFIRTCRAMKEATGNEFVIQTWRGIVGPKRHSG